MDITPLYISDNNYLHEDLNLQLKRLTRGTRYAILLYINDGQLAQWQSKRLLKRAYALLLPLLGKYSTTGTSVVKARPDLILKRKRGQ